MSQQNRQWIIRLEVSEIEIFSPCRDCYDRLVSIVRQEFLGPALVKFDDVRIAYIH